MYKKKNRQVYIQRAKILMRAFSNTDSDFHMEKTENTVQLYLSAKISPTISL